MRILTVATRSGRLAIAQAQIVIDKLKKAHPVLQIKIKEMTTKGDKDRRTILWDLKTTGFFTSLLEDALLADQADLAVHSFKDLPTQMRPELTIAAVCARNFPQDCIVAAEQIENVKQLKDNAKVGTSSLRRAVQLKRLRPDLQIVPLRGNVTTRLRKLEDENLDAIILARAGLQRLGLEDKISFTFAPDDFIPAPAQGALAVQTKSDDEKTLKLVSAIDDRNARIETEAERRVIELLKCGCHAPAGVYAKISGDDIEITAFLSDPDGQNFIKRQTSGQTKNANLLAEQLANKILKKS